MPLNFVAKAAVTVALSAANMAITMSRKIEGPRLDDLKFSSGDYGAALYNIWGTRRVEVPIFWAEDLREVKRRRKTKGGKFNEYTYFGTWAVAIAGHEIAGVRRIWFDTHLVYDLSGAGPVTPFDFGDTGNIDDFISIYLGTDTQEPDPRMQATVEAEFGEGSCPAYRDTAYIVFKDLPLEKLGNRIPQVSVEVASGNAYPSSTLTVGSETAWLTFSADYSSLAVGNFSEYTLVDTAAQAVIYEGTFDPDLYGSSNGFAYRNDGSILAMSSAGSNHIRRYEMGGASAVFFDNGPTQTKVIGLTDADGGEHYLTTPLFAGTPFVFDGAEIDPIDVTGATWSASWFLIDRDNALWAVGGDGTSAYFYRLMGTGAGPGFITVPGFAFYGGDPRALHYQDATHDHFVLVWDGDLYAIDRMTGAIVASNTALDLGGGPSREAVKAVSPQASTMWAGFEEISLADLTRVRLLDATDWGYSNNAVTTIYDPIRHALIVPNVSFLKWNYLDRLGTDAVPLSTVASDIAAMCGITDYDFSALDQEIDGWSTTRGPGSSMLEPLLDAYDCDIRPHDFTIQGVKRSGVTSGSSLETEWFTGDPRYALTIGPEPARALLFDFADMDAEQQPNSVRCDRPLDATDARGEIKLDLTTLALRADDARQLGNRYFRRRWAERRGASLSLTAKELKLEPGDVRSLVLDELTVTARCTRLTVKADDTLATEWLYDHPSLATLDGSAGAPFDGRQEAVVEFPVLSKGFVLDVPLLSDADEDAVPQVYTLAGPYAEGAWPGATIYQEVDGEYSEELAAVPSSSAATWGTVAEAMPYTNPNLWDRSTELTVTLATGSLTGCTEAAALADPTLNLAAIGRDGRWEIVQFTGATLTAPLTYTLSGFRRGRRGTEWAAELHEASDGFVLLDTAEPQDMGLSEVGTGVSFKAITNGRTSGFPFGYDLEGQSLKPYAPAHLEAVKESNGDWTFTWVRRTRVGGAWTSGTPIPLSEASEQYEVTVGDGVSSDTKTVTSATYLWDVATQTADTGAEVMDGDLEWQVAQVSAAVGAGFVAVG